MSYTPMYKYNRIVLLRYRACTVKYEVQRDKFDILVPQLSVRNISCNLNPIFFGKYLMLTVFLSVTIVLYVPNRNYNTY